MPLTLAGSTTGVPSANRVGSLPHLSSGTGANQEIWTIWNNSAVTTGTITTGTSIGTITGPTDIIWEVWNQTYSTTAASTVAIAHSQVATNPAGNVTIWTAWNGQYYQQGMVPASMTEEARQAREAENARWEERRRAAVAQESAANERAEKLLQASLDTKQRSDLSTNGYFELDVISKNGSSRRYRIHRKWSGNIQQVDPGSGKRLKTLCIHPRETVPVADSMLAQKLMLESGMEEELLKIANHS